MDNTHKSLDNNEEEASMALSEANLNRVYIAVMGILLSLTGFLMARELNHFSSSLDKLTEVVQEIRVYQVELRSRLDRIEDRVSNLEKRKR